MKTTILILSALLLLSLAGNYMQYRNKKMEEELRIAQQITFADAITRSNARLAVLDSAHHADRVLDSLRIVQLSRSSERLKTANAGLLQKIKETRPDIQIYLDTIKAVGDHVALMDSAIRSQGSTIDTLTAQNEASAQALENEKKRGQETRAELTGKADTLQLQSDNYQRLFNLADKKASKQLSIGPYLGYGVGRDGLSASAGVSIQYTLFRIGWKKKDEK